MTKWQTIKQARKAYKEGRMGDVAVLKLNLFKFRLHPKALKALEGKNIRIEHIDLDELINYPEGSLGRVYAEHMKKYKLTPFNISPEYIDLANKHIYGTRYIQTHDVFHVLTGFDTSLAGEIGVLYFTYAQKMYRFQAIAAIVAMIIYPILKPHKMKEIIHAAKKGWRMGKKADHLLGIQFEDHWDKPIDQVRVEANLEI